MEPNAGNTEAVHRKIQRSIRNGQCPAIWCSVCGYACRNQPAAKKCENERCVNYCHVSCMTPDAQQFDCAETEQLRLRAGINEPIIYIEEEIETNPDLDIDDELDRMSKEQLVENVRKLRSELSSKNSLLSNFNTLTEDLASKRDAVITVLNLIDNVQAIKTSAQTLSTRTIACSAVPEKIDSEWQTKISSDTTGGIGARTWWQSRPRTIGDALSADSTDPNAAGAQPLSQTTNPRRARSTSPGNLNEEENLQSPSTNQYPRIVHNQNQGTGNSNTRPRNTTQGRTSHQYLRGQTTQITCTHCRKRGHDSSRCRRRQFCEFCRMKGHASDSCRAKQTEERQRTLLEVISEQQARNTEVLARSLKEIFRDNSSSRHTPEGIFRGENLRHRQERTYSQHWNRSHASYRQRY